MRLRFLLGPAGSGKTFRCLEEIRRALVAQPDGVPLVLLAPKQATFQLERQLLSDPTLPGYARLHILSFERLAEFVIEHLGLPEPRLLAEEGRVMVLRALLAREHRSLRLFHASARLPGFARQLSELLRELQRHQIGPRRLDVLAEARDTPPTLAAKLEDAARLLGAYLEWLKGHQLEDADHLLDLAAGALEHAKPGSGAGPLFDTLWLDGFAEMTPQELSLLAAVVPRVKSATLAFCLDQVPPERTSWLSAWGVIGETFRKCHARLRELPGAECSVELLDRDPAHDRFGGSAVLRHLETNFARPRPAAWGSAAPTGQVRTPDLARGTWGDSGTSMPPHRSLSPRRSSGSPQIAPGEGDSAHVGGPTHAGPGEGSFSSRKKSGGLRLGRAGETPEFDFDTPSWRTGITVWQCSTLEAEAIAAATAVTRHVQAGGRYRDLAVLARSLEAVAPVFRRVFRRHGIPCFVDQRAAVNHHPLAELTRSALRTLAHGWRHEDWFGVVKSGLVGLAEWEADRLENEALAHGWEGAVWRSSLGAAATAAHAPLRSRLVEPLLELEVGLGANPSGTALAAGIRQLWRRFEVDVALTRWDSEEAASQDAPDDAGTRHATVGRQLDGWLGEIERAFPEESLGLLDWLPVLESALGGLTVGRVPPALDQVLIGAIDRSRNPDLKLVILPGWNEGVFPTPPVRDGVLSETEREALELAGASLGPPLATRVGHERYYAYIALTRARSRVVITWSMADLNGSGLKPSPYLTHLRRLFPELKSDPFDDAAAQRELPIAIHTDAGAGASTGVPSAGTERLERAIARHLHGPTLHSSVSKLEAFGACPFRFFARSGLRLDERRLFELEARERGSFQHEVLARFHHSVAAQHRHWRDLDPDEARERIRQICVETAATHRDGLMSRNGSAAFTTTHLTRQLQEVVAEAVGWMKRYELSPSVVELEFGGHAAQLPAWKLDLGQGESLSLQGKIDRVDRGGHAEGGGEWAVVFDYKSSPTTFDPILAAEGIQMQLPFYLAAYRALHGLEPGGAPGRVRVGGLAYASLRRSTSRRDNRAEAAKPGARFPVRGCFHLAIHPSLLMAGPESVRTPFALKLKKDGTPAQASDLVAGEEFEALVDAVEPLLKAFGRSILDGAAAVAPYRHGSMRPCDHCEMITVCRVDLDRVRYRRPGTGIAQSR